MSLSTLPLSVPNPPQVFKQKPKPSRPPPPNSASVRYSPSPQQAKVR